MKWVFERLGVAFLALVLASAPALPQAALLPNAKQQYFDANGNPLANGTVTFYIPSTSTKKTTWSDAAETTPNTNPVVLDAAGRATIYGQGSYRQLVKDSAGNTIWDTTTTAPATVAGTYVTDLAPVGTILPFAGTTPPTNYAFAYGQALSRTTYSELYDAITIAQTGSCTSSSTTISALTSTEQMKVGAAVEATCLAPGTTIAAILSSTSIQVSGAALSSASTTIRVFPWGNGNGGTTFNAPDMRGRVPAGRDDMGGTAANVLTYTYCSGASALLSLGSYCGSQSHTMTLAELVAHTHNSGTLGGTTASGGVDHNHDAGSLIIASGQGSHTHTGPGGGGFIGDTGGAQLASGTTRNYNTGAEAAATLPQMSVSGTSGNASAYSHTHTFSVTTGASASTGSTSAFSVVMPVSVVNYIVKYTSVTPGGVGGVISIGGMTGDILCGASLSCASATIDVAALGGDLSGTVASATVAKINGVALGSTTATSGNLLIGSGTQWVTQAMSGDVTINSSGVTAIGALKVTNAMLAGSIAASKLVGTDIATVGTITSGVWNGTAIDLGSYTSGTLAVNRGGTGLTSGTSGGVLAYTGSGTIASSGALTLNAPVIGGGAGAVPTVGARSGNTTTFATTSGALASGNCVKIDANGNLVDYGASCGGTAIPQRVVTTSPDAPTSSDGVLLLNRGSTTAINLPTVASMGGVQLQVIDWTGTSCPCTITPNGAETVMGQASWTLSAGGSMRLIPNTTLGGWAVQ